MVIPFFIAPFYLCGLFQQFFKNCLICLFILPFTLAEKYVSGCLIRCNYTYFIIHSPPLTPLREKRQFSIQGQISEKFGRNVLKDRIQIFIEILFYDIKNDFRFPNLDKGGVWINIPEPEPEEIILKDIIANPGGFFF